MKSLVSISTTFLAAALITGCTFNYDEESFEDIQKQYQYGIADSTSNNVRSDSTYIPRQTTERQNNHNPYECNLMVNAHLVIDGDATVMPPTSLKVTVRKVSLSIERDNNEDNALKLSPELLSEIAEPFEYSGWYSVPQGLDNNGRNVLKEAIPFVYNSYFDASIIIYYVVRVEDAQLADGCCTTYEYKTVRYSSNILHEKDVVVDIPIELTSVKFDASVSNYD